MSAVEELMACVICGAVVAPEDFVTHRDWHVRLRKVIRAAGAELVSSDGGDVL